MNSGVVRLDKIISKVLTLNKHCLLSLLLRFFLANSKHNLIKIKLYNNWSRQAVNNITSSAISNSSNQSIKFVQKSSHSIFVEWRACDRNDKEIYNCCYESKKFVDCSMQKETCQLEKNTKTVKICFKTLC